MIKSEIVGLEPTKTLLESAILPIKLYFFETLLHFKGFEPLSNSLESRYSLQLS